MKLNQGLVDAMVDKIFSEHNNPNIDATNTILDVMKDFEEYKNSDFSDGVEQKLSSKYGIESEIIRSEKIKTRKPSKITALALIAALGLSFVGCKSNNNVNPIRFVVVNELSEDKTNLNSVSNLSNSNNVDLSTNVNTKGSGETTTVRVNTENLLSLDKINEQYGKYGQILINGMTRSDYDAAMNIVWTQINVSGAPETMNVNLSETINYSKIESILYNMAKYDGVSLYDIGDSEQGRNIYKIVLDLNGPTTSGTKKTILLTGGVHAREFGGTDYLLKSLNDLLINAQTDSYLRSLLENVKIVCVPCVNPDGREMVIAGESELKANSNFVDLGRNMPSLNAGQLATGVKKVKNRRDVPGLDFFAGYNLGSESEAQAMIKFFMTYVPTASYYVDHHQMGNFIYNGKPFLSKQGDANSKALANAINKSLKGHYPLRSESSTYGINGDGGTMSDFACSIAEGAQFSYRLGRLVMMVDGKETPLISFRDIDKLQYTPTNKNFGYATIEIGSGAGSRGNSSSARKARNNDYNKYNWENYLQNLIEFTLGSKKVDQIKRTSTLTTIKELREELVALQGYSETVESGFVYTKTI